ncbi:MAG: 6-bladed beta-propeller [Gemmatimonadales bacterium]|nr:6-bladed beta-propeller [Gemmatimonadales bacterium]MDZ4390110.1 6-bladed beta-propeller [Gemmatimonadales bacterium]
MFACSLTGACTKGSHPESAVLSRDIREHQWDTVFALRSLAADTVLWSPSQAFLTDSLVVVVEPTERLLSAFRMDGTLAWQSGAKGSGPGEYAAIADVAQVTDSLIGVLDFAQARLTLIDLSGALVATHKIQLDAPPTSLRPYKSGYLAARYGADQFLVSLDREMQQIATIPVNYPGVDVLPRMARQYQLATDDDGNWVLSYIFGGGLVSGVDSGTSHVSYVGSPAFPSTRSMGDAGDRTIEFVGPVTCVACGSSLSHDTAYVLAGQVGDSSRRIVDLYPTRPHIRYHHSIVLPVRARFMTVSNRGYLVGTADSAGQQVLLLVPRSLSR